MVIEILYCPVLNAVENAVFYGGGIAIIPYGDAGQNIFSRSSEEIAFSYSNVIRIIIQGNSYICQ